MRSLMRQSLCTALFSVGTLLILALIFVPLARAHQGWEDEIFWFSTCLSIVRHHRPIPSVLADFSGTHSPLYFYGPTLFWLGALAIKAFGATMLSWRGFTLAGYVLFLAGIAVLFRQQRGSWCAGAGAAFVFSLSLTISFWFTLPGRADGWTLALIVFALVIASSAHMGAESRPAASAIRWLVFGSLIGAAASTTPRCWPLLFSLLLALPLLTKGRSLGVGILICAACLAAMAVIFLPLHTTPWGHVAYVHRASSSDPVNAAPLLGGAWTSGRETSQLAYYGVVIVILGLMYLPRWREQEPFSKWLLLAGMLNLVGMMLLVSRAVSTPTFWSFPLEAAALLALMLPARSWNAKTARAMGLLLLAYMVILRAAREAPVFMHWKQRDPEIMQRAIASIVPPGSVVYGPIGEYFYPVFQSGSDYRYLVERTTFGLSSVPGKLDTPSPMAGACGRASYLIWPTGAGDAPMPQVPHASVEHIFDQPAAPQIPESFERSLEKTPGGRGDPDDEAFAIYRLHPDQGYCAKLDENTTR
jgi:hypothetical protein